MTAKNFCKTIEAGDNKVINWNQQVFRGRPLEIHTYKQSTQNKNTLSNPDKEGNLINSLSQQFDNTLNTNETLVKSSGILHGNEDISSK